MIFHKRILNLVFILWEYDVFMLVCLGKKILSYLLLNFEIFPRVFFPSENMIRPFKHTIIISAIHTRKQTTVSLTQHEIDLELLKPFDGS